MAFQFPIDPITRIMEGGLTLGQTAETYLVGPDLTLRSGLAQDKKKALIEEKILTDQTKLLKQEEEKGIAAILEHEVLIYEGPHGKKVLGFHLIIIFMAGISLGNFTA